MDRMCHKNKIPGTRVDSQEYKTFNELANYKQYAYTVYLTFHPVKKNVFGSPEPKHAMRGYNQA